jgi:DNA topoisomerase-3
LVINCGDAGQEGELIQRWVMNEANYKGEVQRLWISLTTEAIREGFENLKPSATTIIYTMPDFPEPLATGY